MSSEFLRIEFAAMGTQWEVKIWDDVENEIREQFRRHITESADQFEKIYSRFLPDSLIRRLSQQTGKKEVPQDLTRMLRICEALNEATEESFNPFVGHALEDLGYDQDYSLTPKETVRTVPNFDDAIEVNDDTHITLKKEALIDLGALGKGYFTDRIAEYLESQNIKKYLVNGSGDIRCRAIDEPVRAGLEHPLDPTKVIGLTQISEGALCASSSNRRSWGNHNHELNALSPETKSPVLSTWVMCPNAALADALATCLFFATPEQLQEACDFEYLLLNEKMETKKSRDFIAELF